jgi:D-alanine-D-alanine ligase
MGKLTIALVFGGRSAEHEISLLSAQNVIDAIDKDRYHLCYIAIDKEGNWYTNTRYNGGVPVFPLSLDHFNDALSLSLAGDQKLFVLSSGTPVPVDLFFPILHGPYGEDGTIQGLFRTLDTAFVGCDVLGSAAGMDKEVMKRLLVEAGIPIGKYLSAFRDTLPSFDEVEKTLGLPVYVKPANMGSSVGISKVKDRSSYEAAVGEAFRFDRKIVIEENIEGLELECAILGNREPQASAVGRVIAYHEFYTYTSKYLDDQGFKLEIPAKIPAEKVEAVRDMALRVFRATEAEGLARVDVFLKPDGQILVNEINTMPGFTSISMYPMLWKEMGLSYTELIDRLIELALERHKERKRLATSYV